MVNPVLYLLAHTVPFHARPWTPAGKSLYVNTWARQKSEKSISVNSDR